MLFLYKLSGSFYLRLEISRNILKEELFIVYHGKDAIMIPVYVDWKGIHESHRKALQDYTLDQLEDASQKAGREIGLGYGRMALGFVGSMGSLEFLGLEEYLGRDGSGSLMLVGITLGMSYMMYGAFKSVKNTFRKLAAVELIEEKKTLDDLV